MGSHRRTAVALLLLGLASLVMCARLDDPAPPSADEWAAAPSRTPTPESAPVEVAELPLMQTERIEASLPSPPQVDPTRAENRLRTRIYSLKDLLWGDASDARTRPADIKDLEVVIRQATDGNYWRQDGAKLETEESGLLSVTASADMQERVGTLLRDMRRASQPQGR